MRRLNILWLLNHDLIAAHITQNHWLFNIFIIHNPDIILIDIKLFDFVGALTLRLRIRMNLYILRHFEWSFLVGTSSD